MLLTNKINMVSSSSIRRAFGSLFFKFSNGFPTKCPNSFPLRGTSLRLIKNLASLSSLNSSSEKWVVPSELQFANSVRKIRTSAPLCMGRRSCKIAGRKGAQDAKKRKMHSKIGKQVVSAIKKGGPNLASNTALAAILEKAKELDIPKEIIERNIKRASEKGQEAYIEKFYEVYGYGGVSIIVEVLTDKITRSVAAVRDVVKECGGKMADPGSILFKFRRALVVNLKVTEADKDQLLNIALDAGADDVLEPHVDEDDTEEDKSERYYKIVSSSENYAAILSKLHEEGVKFETGNGYELLPLTPIEDRATKIIIGRGLEGDNLVDSTSLRLYHRLCV